VDVLSEDEMALWHAWKVAAEAVRTRVGADISAATGLSDPDFAVLTRVAELGDGRLRQNKLAASMGYQRSRLSHHLSRMVERGLIARETAGDGVDVLLTDGGRAAVEQARPVHAAAVRKHLLEPLAGMDRGALAGMLAALS
jgi:DNA-binding MarR family transcriptional regulator